MAFFRKTIMMVLLVVVMATFESTMAAMYQVGDSGWDFNNNYDQWASSKNFKAGDTLVFKYNPQLHNVRQVNINDYNSCTDQTPIASFDSGSDSVTLPTPGDYYFICGIPGHCAAGLKLHVKIAASSTTSPSNPVTPTTPSTNTPSVTPPTPFFPVTPTNPSTNTPPENGYFDLPPGLPLNKPIGEYRQPDSAQTKLFPMSMLFPLLLLGML